MKLRAVLFALPLALALTGCDGDSPTGGDSCQTIVDLCHDVDPGTGPISECHDIGHELDEDACAPIEAECVALCEAAAEAQDEDHDTDPTLDGGAHDHGDH